MIDVHINMVEFGRYQIDYRDHVYWVWVRSSVQINEVYEGRELKRSARVCSITLKESTDQGVTANALRHVRVGDLQKIALAAFEKDNP